MRIAVLLNQEAGAGVLRDGRTLGDRLADAFAGHGIEADVQFLPPPELKAGAESALQQARSKQLAALVVGGGDGSIASVASVLAETGVPLGILPLGTLNHFAKDLRVPLGLDAAVETIAAGSTRSVDLGEVNGEIFINNSSIGIYPYLVADRDRLRAQHGMGKWTAMALAAWRTLRHFPIRRLSISAGSAAKPYRSPCVFVGNNEYGLSGRVMGKRERLDGGELCVYVAKRQSRLSMFWLACRSVVGLLNDTRDLHMVTAPHAEIRSHTSRLLVALDGEVTVIRPPLRYRIRPKALRVFAPQADCKEP